MKSPTVTAQTAVIYSRQSESEADEISVGTLPPSRTQLIIGVLPHLPFAVDPVHNTAKFRVTCGAFSPFAI